MKSEPGRNGENARPAKLNTGMETGGDPAPDLSAQARTLVDDLRGALAAVRAGGELLIRPDLSQLQSQRVARNVIAAAARIEEILSDFSLQLIDASPH